MHILWAASYDWDMTYEIWYMIYGSHDTLSEPIEWLCMLFVISVDTWRHVMETLLAWGSPLVTSGFPSQRASDEGFVFFYANLEETVKLPVISDAMMVMWHNCNAWAEAQI